MNNVIGVKEKRILLKNCDSVNENRVVTTGNIEACLKRGGYKSLDVAFKLSQNEIIAEIKKSGLIGRGGACFPTGLKWQMAHDETEKEKYFICNADEGEPGTFKDKILLEQDPHQIIEGMIIAAYAIGAAKGYVYIRGEYPDSIRVMENAICEAKNKGFLGSKIKGTNFSFDVSVFKGMGAYICGEETALIESIEGKRGIPRTKPPYPISSGLHKKPTVINNVETISNIPHIILNGSNWYRGLGVEGSFGTKLFSISGHVKKPGIYEVELGKYSLNDLIYGLAGGVEGDKAIKAVIPGGASTCFLNKESLNVKIDYQSLKKVESSLGTGAIIVFDETTCIPEIVKQFFDFYYEESCGYCVPCRLGTKAIKDMLTFMLEPATETKEKLSVEQLIEMGNMMQQASRCGLGQSAANPLLSSIRLFEEDYQTLMDGKK